MKNTTLILLALVLFVVMPASAKNNRTYPTLPEVPEMSGTYQDPKDKDVLVRVNIHRPKRATQQLLTCSDEDSTLPISASIWKLPTGRWTYNLNPSSVPAGVGAANIPTIADLGFDQWETAQSSVTFSRGANTTLTRSRNDRLNIIAWGKTSASALAVTYGYYNSQTGIILDVDTIMNTNRTIRWSWTPYTPGSCGVANTFDAQAVLTHEQGHWLGADDEYTEGYIHHTMYGYGTTGDISSDTLTTGDKSGITSYYQ